jgi:hypothetical protein
MRHHNPAILIPLLIALLAANASAQTDAQNMQSAFSDNQRVSVYLHPISFFTAFSAGIYQIYSTVEIPLNLSASLIITPDVWFSRGEKEEGTNTSRGGSGAGIRYFPGGAGEGLYLQALASAHYYSIKYKEGWWYYTSAGTMSNEPKKGVSYDLLLYLGNAYKFRSVSIFSDVGAGIGNAKHADDFYKNNAIIEFNLGIGLPF